MKFSKPMGRTQLSGPLDYDPELRFTPGGHPVCSLVLVAEDGSQSHLEAWDERAEQMAEKLVRGSVIVAEGYWKTRTWEDREGQSHSREIFTVESYTMEPPF